MNVDSGRFARLCGAIPRTQAISTASYKKAVDAVFLDASFTPVRRASYEVENMRVGDRTDHNRLIVSIETDGTVSPRTVLEHSIETMIKQLQAIVGFRDQGQIEIETEDELVN